MAYVRTGGAGRTELVVVASDGSGERVVSSRQLPERFWPAGPGVSFAPAWSPDGATIAVLGAREGDRSTGQIVFVNVGSGSERTADAGPVLFASGLGWLSDDTLLASMVDKPSALLQLWLVSRTDGTFRRLTNDTSQYQGVSLTADRTALVTARLEFSFTIWTGDAAGGKWTPTVPAKPAKSNGGFGVRWLGDDLVYVSSPSQGFALMRWRASTRSEEMLAPSSGSPSVSRDGSTILFADYDLREIWTMDAAGQNRARRRCGVAAAIDVPHVTPDGRYYVTIGTTADNSPAVVRVALSETNDSQEISVRSDRAGWSAALRRPA
jgi:Tol biopolymer transport system component